MVALNLTVIQSNSPFFSASQVRDLAIVGWKRQSQTGFELNHDCVQIEEING